METAIIECGVCQKERLAKLIVVRELPYKKKLHEFHFYQCGVCQSVKTLIKPKPTEKPVHDPDPKPKPREKPKALIVYPFTQWLS